MSSTELHQKTFREKNYSSVAVPLRMSVQPRKTSNKHGMHLWEFLLDLLADEKCSSVIDWTNKENGEFKLKNQEEVAKRWGDLKHRPGMNYDKLSRALRYYYQKGIIKKVNGQRLVYRFCNPPHAAQKKQVSLPAVEEKEEKKVQCEDSSIPNKTQEKQNPAEAKVHCPTICRTHPYTLPFQALSGCNVGYTVVQAPLVSGGHISIPPYHYVMPIVVPAHRPVAVVRT